MSRGFVKPERHVDLSAGDVSGDGFPDPGLDDPELFRQTDIEVEKPVINCTDFPDESAEVKTPFDAGKAGHAPDHAVPLGQAVAQC